MKNTPTNIWKSGDVFIWLTGGALALSLIMVITLIGLIAWNGAGIFWPGDLHLYTMKDGRVILAQVVDRITTVQSGTGNAPESYRIKVKQANRSLTNSVDFAWLNESDILKDEMPADAVIIERREWGDYYGFVEEVREGGKFVAKGTEEGLKALQARLPRIAETIANIRQIEKDKIGDNSAAQETVRIGLKRLEKEGIATGPEVDKLNRRLAELQQEYKTQENALVSLRGSLVETAVMKDGNGKPDEVKLSAIVRVYRPNAMGFFDKCGHYFSKLGEFIFDDPRESNTEGGVWPALYGTIMMIIIMSVVVTPLGVIAAFYLREYAKQGAFVSIVRIAVNNLAGVPSIVFGVFGLGFFIYFCGGSIDRIFFSDSLPTPTYGTGGILWASLTLALLTVPVVIVATEEGLAAVPKGFREASLALGATKFETTVRVVLPAVMPSVLTGLILAMARAAGEVAPLMITGVVKLAPTLPLDGHWPFMHFDRKFMHLGFHIYDVGFQSPNVDAARPMVFATTLLLLFIVGLLNIFAIALRNRLRRKYATSAV